MTENPSPPWIADFDSSTGMLRALAACLEGRPLDALGLGLPLRLGAPLVNALPLGLRRRIYALGGLVEAIAPETLAEVRDEAVAGWMAGLYPAERYPGIAIGSSNGALTHLWARLGVPWLPQTYLIPVRQQGVGIDRPDRAMEEGARVAPALLRANPGLQLHQMHDASQDRLMIRHMMYFRVKRRRLPQAFRALIEERLRPGATVFIVDCRTRWPVTEAGERHLFQHGGYGGLAPEEYVRGGQRVSAFLARQGSDLERWPTPEPTTSAPEAEWGFEPSLMEDLRALCRERGLRLVRLVLAEPESASAPVADLCRDPGRIGRDRLMAESFILTDPYRAMRHGLVPFWCCFAVQCSLARLRAYLASRPAFAEIGVALFPHGTDSVDLARPEEWQALFAEASGGGRFLGADPKRFPADFAGLARFSGAVERFGRNGQAAPTLAMDEAILALRAAAGDGVTVASDEPVSA